jgi:hypothetical protein
MGVERRDTGTSIDHEKHRVRRFDRFFGLPPHPAFNDACAVRIFKPAVST